MINIKKLVVFFSLVLFLFLLVQGRVLADIEDIESGLDKNIEKAEDIEEDIGELDQKLSDEKWDYLGKEWKKIFLGNSAVGFVDNSLKKVNIVFVILFAEDYKFSLGLFFVIVFWIYFFFTYSKILGNYSTFSSGVVLVISFGLAIITTQIGIIRVLVNFFAWLITLPENSFIRVLIFIGIVVALFLIYKINSFIGVKFDKSKEEMAKEQEKLDRGVLGEFVKHLFK